MEITKIISVSLQIFVVLLVGIAAIWTVAFLTPKPPQQVVHVPTDYETKDSFKILELITTTDQYSNSVVINSDGRNKPTNVFSSKLVVKGTIVGGYLDIVASTKNGKLETESKSSFDDVYINLYELTPDGVGSKNYGGHLVESRSLKTPHSEESTELLFSLADIPVLEDYLDRNNKVTSLNWLPLLAEQNKNAIEAFVSTYKVPGEIKKLSIYYKCLENTECSIVKSN